MNSVFVTGTDTDVGKTRISVALIELLQRQGKRVAAMKPIASGCELTIDGLRNDDAMKSIGIFTSYFSNSVDEGRSKGKMKSNDKSGEDGASSLVEEEILSKFDHDVDLKD